MSAIFGVVHWDGSPLAGEPLDLLGRQLRHRGEKPGQIWRDGSAALGHCLLSATPESVAEVLPAWCPGECLAITADARIDNRKELLALPATTGAPPGAVVPDSELILRAYVKWGEQCAAKLLGDFAFAIWDARRRRLFCVRDHFGVKPLYYFYHEKRLAFASEATALRKLLPEKLAGINDGTVARFLAGMLDDGEETFYTGIRRVSPAHFVSVDDGAIRAQRYYEYQPAEIRFRRDEDYAEHWREVFTRAVSRRLRGSKPVACMLSGGLDSSSIACVASQLAGAVGTSNGSIHTFTNSYPESPSCDESPYIDAVLQRGRFEAHFNPVKSVRTMADLDRFVETLGEPSMGVGLFANEPLYPFVRAAGLNVILDGHGGDEVVSDQPAILRELAEQDRWFTLLSEWIPLAWSRGEPIFKPLKDFVLAYGAPGRWRRRLRLRQRLPWLSRSREAGPQPLRRRWEAHLDERLLAASALVSRRPAWLSVQPEATGSAQLAHWRRIFNTGQGIALEALDRLAAASAVEARYPFWDKEVVEFCLAIPPAQKVRYGRDRSVLRRGLRKILPEKVRLRRVKTSFGEQVLKSLTSLNEEKLKDLLQECENFGILTTDKSWYVRAVEKMCAQKTMEDIPILWRAISIMAWLRWQRSPERQQPRNGGFAENSPE